MQRGTLFSKGRILIPSNSHTLTFTTFQQYHGQVVSIYLHGSSSFILFLPSVVFPFPLAAAGSWPVVPAPRRQPGSSIFKTSSHLPSTPPRHNVCRQFVSTTALSPSPARHVADFASFPTRRLTTIFNLILASSFPRACRPSTGSYFHLPLVTLPRVHFEIFIFISATRFFSLHLFV